MSKRRRGREMAVQMLYQHDLGGASRREIVSGFDPREPLGDGAGNGDNGAERPPVDAAEEEEAFEYAKSLLEGTLAEREEIDEMIRRQAENWRLERMPVVDRNILRLAVYELMHETEVPKLVVIDEAIELAKRFGSERSSRFINGLLDGLLRAHRFPGTMT